MEVNNCDRTPKRVSNSELTTRKTPMSTPKSFASRFLLLSNNKSSTPSPSSLKNHLIVRNPFESNHLHDKLHLPVISSPSLFHAPSTPKNNSSRLEVFEWTIEELSNLNPVNVIPHETQFRLEETTDPDKEAQVQAAISSFFKEQQVVPSPLIRQSTCSKVAAAAAIFSVKVQKTTTENRDMTTQTALSFPPNLPREIEDLLKQYQHNDECNTNDKNDERETNTEENDRSMMDISTLRRKLFIQHETPERHQSMSNENFAIDLNLSPAPRTPEFSRQTTTTSPDINKNDDYDDDGGGRKKGQRINSDLFGELSPIGKFDSFSTTTSSPIMSSSTNDISMASDYGTQEQTPTGRQRCNFKKKRLSDSFSMLHNEDSLSEKENNFEFHPIMSSGGCGGAMLYRCDSGFREDSNQLINLSTEFMQI